MPVPSMPHYSFNGFTLAQDLSGTPINDHDNSPSNMLKCYSRVGNNFVENMLSEEKCHTDKFEAVEKSMKK
jgi:hypothetical protein